MKKKNFLSALKDTVGIIGKIKIGAVCYITVVVNVHFLGFEKHPGLRERPCAWEVRADVGGG